MSLRGDSCSARSNPERILQLKTVCCVEPNNNNMDCRVALAPRNDAKLFPPRLVAQLSMIILGIKITDVMSVYPPPEIKDFYPPTRGG